MSNKSNKSNKILKVINSNCSCGIKRGSIWRQRSFKKRLFYCLNKILFIKKFNVRFFIVLYRLFLWPTLWTMSQRCKINSVLDYRKKYAMEENIVSIT